MANIKMAGSNNRLRLHGTSLNLLRAVPMLLILLPACIVGFKHIRVPVTYDDAFITYRYARNFAQGQGLVFNHGQRYLGTTAPGYALLLGMLGLPNPAAIPVISIYISVFSTGLTGLALYLYGLRHHQALSGFLSGLFYVCTPMTAWLVGGETIFVMSLVMWALVFYTDDRTVVAALILALSIIVRLDCVIAVGVMGLHYLWQRRRFPVREAVCLSAVVLPFACGAFFYYGSPLPGTLAAKMAQHNMFPGFIAGTVSWVRTFAGQPSTTGRPMTNLFIYFAAIGIPSLWLFRFWLLPLAWVVLYVMSYHVLGVPFYPWYVVPIVLALSILAGCGGAGIAESATRLARRCGIDGLPRPLDGLIQLACIGIVAVAVSSQVQWTTSIIGDADDTAHFNEQLGLWLKAHVPEAKSVGYFEMGRVGWYSDRTLIDALGLVSPGVAAHVAQGDLTWAFANYRPDYIIDNNTSVGAHAVVQQRWFRQSYRQIAAVKLPSPLWPFAVYERRKE